MTGRAATMLKVELTKTNRGAMTVLWRSVNQWNIWAANLCPGSVDAAHEQCRRATTSPWIWWGPDAVGRWLIDHPSTPESDIPRSIIVAAQTEMDHEVARLTRGLDLAKTIRAGLVARPTKREVRQKQKQVASRRKR